MEEPSFKGCNVAAQKVLTIHQYQVQRAYNSHYFLVSRKVRLRILKHQSPIPGLTSLVDEVQAYFEGTNSASATKAKVLHDIGLLVQKYPMVTGSAYRHSVTNLILFLAEQNSSIHLSADDVSAVWFR
jgi:hypothetical protein